MSYKYSQDIKLLWHGQDSKPSINIPLDCQARLLTTTPSRRTSFGAHLAA